MAKNPILVIVEKERVLRCFRPYGHMAEKMETLKVQMRKEKSQRVREIAAKRFGFAKGSVSKALDEALDDWVVKNDAKKSGSFPPEWKRLRGALKDIKMSSVELQHNAFLLRNPKDHR